MSLKDTKFGAYTIVRQLSAGDTSEVYLAKREGFAGFARQVVIKCVPQHISADSKFIEQFRDEAQLVARLNHPNIVPVHEFGQEGETHYLMMEYIPGISLEEAITKTFGIEPSHVLRVASEMCSGLSYAHSLKSDEGSPLGIVHRNINPQNVLLGFDGSVKLIDFGIAKASTLSQETRTALFKGKYGYLSPEQANGEAVDHRTDIHAIGVVVWEMLMGFPLYDKGNAVDTVEAVLHEKPSPVIRRHPELSKTIDEILAKMLAKDPSDRYESAADLQEVIEEFIATSGRLTTTTALGKFVTNCVEPEADSLGDETKKEVEVAPFFTAKTSRQRPEKTQEGLGPTKRFPQTNEETETNEILTPTSRRKAEPYFLNPPPGPPPTVRVAPLKDYSTHGSDEHERMDPTIPMPGKHQPGSGIGAHLARLAAAQTPDETSAPPQTPSYPPPSDAAEEPEYNRSVSLWIVSSGLGVLLVAAVTFLVMRTDVLEDLTSAVLNQTSTKATIARDASSPPTKQDAAKELPVVQPISQGDADLSFSMMEAGVLPEKLPTAFLTVRSEPSGAQLFLDGNATREWTRIHDLPIDPGQHTIELVLLGYQRWKQEISAERGQRLVLRANLKLRPESENVDPPDAGERADFGILSVNTTPPSLVYVGRKTLGQTPVSDVELPSGEHRLTFLLETGRRIRRSIRIRTGRTTRHNFDFTPSKRREPPPTKEAGPSSKQGSPTSEQDSAPTKGSSPPTKEAPPATKRPQSTPSKQTSTTTKGATQPPEESP